MQPSQKHLLDQIAKLKEIKEPSKAEKSRLIQLNAEAKAKGLVPSKADEIPADDVQKEPKKKTSVK